MNNKTDTLPNKVIPSHFIAYTQPSPHNGRKSTRFNVLTFLPIAILFQFLRVINCFYFINAILQSTPSISTNSPLATIIPLSFVIVVGVIKEAIVEI